MMTPEEVEELRAVGRRQSEQARRTFAHLRERAKSTDAAPSEMRPVTLLPKTSRVTLAEIESRVPVGDVIACDFYIDEIEVDATAESFGFRKGRVLNIDHHAPVATMSKEVSSTNLAIDYVGGMGPANANTAVVINHTDCDSILSSAIVAGNLPPLAILGEAAIAADHTGEENDIADLLQGMDSASADLRAETERMVLYEAALRNVSLLLGKAPLEPEAQRALNQYRAKRGQALALVERGEFTMLGDVAFAVTDEKIDGAFFPALLPDAQVIMVATRAKRDPKRWNVKLRLGRKASEGSSLHNLRLSEALDPGWGGRWNAGSNARAGGTDIDPLRYAAEVSRRLESVDGMRTP